MRDRSKGQSQCRNATVCGSVTRECHKSALSKTTSADSSWFLADLQPLAKGLSFFGCLLCMLHKWTRDSKYSCRRAKIKIFAPPVQTPIAWFSLGAKLFAPLSSLPVNSTPHEIVFRALLPYVIGWLNCAKMYLLQQRKFSTRDVNESRSCSLLFLGFLNEKLFENATIGLSDVYRWIMGKAEFSSLPLTLTVPWSSIYRWSLIIESNLIGNFYFWFKYSNNSLRLRLNSWLLSVVTLLR